GGTRATLQVRPRDHSAAAHLPPSCYPISGHLSGAREMRTGKIRVGETSLRTKNIFVFGSSLTSTYWNGAATYYRGIYKYLHRLGYRIIFAEPAIYSRQDHRD